MDPWKDLLNFNRTLRRRLPLWLAPVQAVVLPTLKNMQTMHKSNNDLKLSGVRCELDARSESLGARIRDAEMQKIPYILVVGDKEIDSGSVSVRRRHSKDTQTQPVNDLLSTLKQEIANRTNN